MRYLALIVLVVAFTHPLGANPSGAPEALALQERLAIFKTLCEGEVTRDGQGLLCPGDADEEHPRKSERRWSVAIPGRFAAGDGEWLVSLAAPCIGGCGGETYVLRRTGKGWERLVETDGLVHARCAVISGMADGFLRVACTHSAGPHFGGMFKWLDVVSFAGGSARSRNLLQKDQGGECWLAHPPDTAEYHDDEISNLKAGPPGSPTALNATLTIRRLDKCDSTAEDPERSATVRGRHVLRFVKQGPEIVPDQETAATLARYDWELPKE